MPNIFFRPELNMILDIAAGEMFDSIAFFSTRSFIFGSCRKLINGLTGLSEFLIAITV
jgi:hypothetical protein